MCGDDAATDAGTYCAEHQPLRGDKAPRARDVRRTPDAVVDQLQANLSLQLGLVASMWQMRDPVCGAALAASADNIAEFWAGRARSSPAIARALDSAIGAGGVLAGLAVHAPLIMAITAHHVAPAIERRRAGLAGDDQAVTVLHDDAGRPYVAGPYPEPPAGGTLPDEAAAAAAAWLDHERDANGSAPFVDDLMDPNGSGLPSWDAAADEAARAAVAGEPWGATAWPPPMPATDGG